jgi:dihydroflavonol-4-reductase
MKRVLLTGANGFLGNNLVRELTGRGYTVHAFIQEGADPSILDGLDVIRFSGDLLKPDTLRKSIEGCDYIIHSAGLTTINPAKVPMARLVNVEGTRRILDLALEYGVKRVVHVGTSNTFGFGSKTKPGNETSPFSSGHYGLDYITTKLEAHNLALSYFRNHGLPIIIVNPTFMIGPNDPGPSSNLMIKQIVDRKLPGYCPGGRNFASVKDNCIAIVNALTMGKPGESYILGNRNMNYKEFYALIGKVTGAKTPWVYLPAFLIKPMGAVLSGMAAIFPRFHSDVNLSIAKIACDEQFFSSDKAIRELQLPQSPIEDAIWDSFVWLRDNGKLVTI